MRFEFIDRHRREFPVGRTCRLLRVSRSDYYGRRRRPESERRRQNRRLVVEIRAIHGENRTVYGSPRV